MFPGSTQNDRTNHGVAYAELAGKTPLLFASGSPRPDCQHLIGGQLGRVVRLSALPKIGINCPSVTPSLAVHVPVIVALVSQEEMLRTDTRRVIAGMEYVQAGGDVAICDNPGEAVSAVNPLIGRAEDAVPVGHGLCASPYPTRPQLGTVGGDGAVLIDAGPEFRNVVCHVSDCRHDAIIAWSDK